MSKKNSIPTLLMGKDWLKEHPSRDAAIRWFRANDFLDHCVVYQRQHKVAEWLRGKFGGVQVRRIAA